MTFRFLTRFRLSDPFPPLEVDVLDPQPQALHQPEAGAVEQAGGQPGGFVELGQDGAGFVAAEDGRQPFGVLARTSWTSIQVSGLPGTTL